MPQYQGMWTMQKVAQLQSQQQWANDPQFDNTILLLQADNAENAAQNNTFLDSSSAANPITRFGNPHQGAFSPFSATGWSSYFPGGAASTNVLTVADNAALRPNTNNFTLEFWINFSSLTGFQGIFSKGGTAANQLLIRTDSGTGTLLVVVSGTTIITASSSSSVGVWDHYALVRSGNTWTLYRNGTSVGTATNSTSISTTSGIFIGGVSVTFNSLVGYLSNFRFTIGAALYTSSFTPSTTPLTTTSQGASAAQVELLTCQSNRYIDNSTNNFTITPSGSPSIQPFSPFAPQYQWSQNIVGGCGYFDGNGDYLRCDSALSTITSTAQSFTVECWVYPLSAGDPAPASDLYFIGFNTISTGANEFLFACQNIYYNTTAITLTRTILPFQWTHFAAVYDGAATKVYVNGILSNTLSGTVGPLNLCVGGIGCEFDGASGGTPGNYFNGYISDFRIVVDTQVYTADFTPPTAPLTAISGTTLLGSFTNAAIFDGTMKNSFESSRNAQVSTSVVKYGAGSIAFDGVDDFLLAPYSPLFSFGTGQFTIECWVNFTTLSTNRIIFDTYTAASTGGGYQLFWRSTGTSIAFYANGAVVAQSSFTGHTTGVWYHIAVTRDASSVVRIFVDGTQYASVNYASATAIDMATTGNVCVGIQAITLTNDLHGYIDDLRVTKGVARYTANFTPPQVALQRQ
jgi:hypothetical protein